MRYWWVNQNQTYRHEVPGGYLWSPKVKANGAVNPFYEFMREVAPGDVVFSFADTHIRAIGIARSHAYEAPKPIEFGTVGAYWETIGWRVDVHFTELQGTIRPSEHMGAISPYLPARYAPLQKNGAGQQGIYLTELDDLLASLLVDLIGSEARAVIQNWRVSELVPNMPLAGQIDWEEHQLAAIRDDSKLQDTEKHAIVLSRRGQGLFRSRVSSIEKRCRVTGVSKVEYLRASHSKPWRDSSNDERLDGENGLLLTPDVDLLFDRGLIGFEDNGRVLISPVADVESLEKMGLTSEMLRNVGAFSMGQREYLQFHRENVFLQARLRGR
jgi:hypothetical protein